MTLHEVRLCAPTMEAWEEMIYRNVLADEPADAENAVRLAVRKTLAAVAMRQTISGDAAEVVKQINARETTDGHR